MLRKAEGSWEREKVDPEFRKTVADICNFVTRATHEGQTFFDNESELALDAKIERIRN